MLIDPPGCWFSLHRPQPANSKRRALFLDRDGVIIPDRPYRSDAANLELVDGVVDLIRRAVGNDWAVIVVTNQSGIGRGYFTWSNFAEVNDAMIAMLGSLGAPVDAVLAAAWHETAPEGQFPIRQSQWRKPKPGMMLAAAEQLDIDLANSCMIGDRQSDMAAAHAAGVGLGLFLSDRSNDPCDRNDGFDQHFVESLSECIPYIAGQPIT